MNSSTNSDGDHSDAHVSAIEKLVNSKVTVLVLCFAVLGFFGVPLICVSKGFTRSQKIFWSVVVIVYTLILVAITAASIWFAWRQWQEILG